MCDLRDSVSVRGSALLRVFFFLLAPLASAEPMPPIIIDPNAPYRAPSGGDVLEVRSLEFDLAPFALAELEGANGPLTDVVAKSPKQKIQVVFENGKPKAGRFTPVTAWSVVSWPAGLPLTTEMRKRVGQGTAFGSRTGDGRSLLASGFAVVVEAPAVFLDVQFVHERSGHFRRHLVGEFDRDGVFHRAPAVLSGGKSLVAP